jgi:hypothetical protein
MKTIKPAVLVVAGATMLMSFAGMWAPAADPPAKEKQPRSKVAFFMRAKLANSQSVLEGLTTEDFDLIRTGAQRMIVMTKAAEWKVGGGEVYTQDSVKFVDAAQDLIKNSNEKNIDGATLAYLQLTMNCVNCHKHVRSPVAADKSVP